MDRKRLSQLRRILCDRFNETELRDLSFDLGVNYDGLSGGEMTGKARELVAFLQRRGRVDELLETGKQLRPDIDWDELLASAAQSDIWITTREASDLTGYNPRFLQRLAKKRWVRARKEKRKWLFDQQVVEAHAEGWIGTNEASDLTGYSTDYLRWLAREELVKAYKLSGFWLLQQSSLLAYCRSRGRL